MLGRLTAIAVGVVVFLLFGELAVRLMGYQAMFDTYSRPSVFWIHDPLLGWVHEPNSVGTYVGPRPWPIEFEASVKINSLGLRGPEVTDVPEGGYRVLVLGDSLTAAFEVEYEETFAAILERQLTEEMGAPVQVINAGVRGYGTDQSYLSYRDRLRKLQPDMVIMFHSFNDPENNVTLHRMRRPFGKAALSPQADGTLAPRGYPIPLYPLCSSWVLGPEFEPTRMDTPFTRATCWAQVGLADHSALFTWMTMRIRRNPDLLRRLYGLGDVANHIVPLPGSPRVAGLGGLLLAAGAAEDSPTDAPDRWALTESILHAFQREVVADGAQFVLIIRRAHWKRMMGLQADGILARFVEMTGPMSGETAMRYIRFQNDAHLNETGHEIMARMLEEVIAPLISNDPAAEAP
ncbi:MAG: hypothetical protein IH884_08560 [Myxococcales bacterium]|nr:hypothetical protein [Myxococcales bacterium]